MNRLAVLFIAGCLYGITPACAQEFTAQKPESIAHPTDPVLLWRPSGYILPAPWWNPHLQPQQPQMPKVLQPKRRTERRKERELNRDAQLWSASIGNTGVNNWSPYPDRALDARNLSFPLPKEPQQPRK